jgi:hypothetical protein
MASSSAGETGPSPGGPQPLVVCFDRAKIFGALGFFVAMGVVALFYGFSSPGLLPKFYMTLYLLCLGWLLTIFFRNVLPRVRSGRVAYTIDDSGIHGALLLVSHVPWEDIAAVKKPSKHRTGLIEVRINNYGKYVPPALTTRRHRVFQRLFGFGIAGLDIATMDFTSVVSEAQTAVSAVADFKDGRVEVEGIDKGLLRVPTRGTDHDVKQVLAAINSHLIARRSTIR